ncbi:hypothetical protein BJ742DRAFT_858396 [Cladochytrium replicatum]|nr:hypothetical protein BJ742DRAFT_858396 [Cladochytrium replicatum]
MPKLSILSTALAWVLNKKKSGPITNVIDLHVDGDSKSKATSAPLPAPTTPRKSSTFLPAATQTVLPPSLPSDLQIKTGQLITPDPSLISAPWDDPSYAHQTSALDAIVAPLTLLPIALFYPSPSTPPRNLLPALSRTVARFPLLSGRIKLDQSDKKHFEITKFDAGVWVEFARADSVPMARYVGIGDRPVGFGEGWESPDLWFLFPNTEGGGVPREVKETERGGMKGFLSYIGKDVPLVHVRVTEFKDGGWALGIVAAHAVVDGMALGDFLREWARECKAEKEGAEVAPMFVTDADLNRAFVEPLDVVVESPLTLAPPKLSISTSFGSASTRSRTRLSRMRLSSFVNSDVETSSAETLFVSGRPTSDTPTLLFQRLWNSNVQKSPTPLETDPWLPGSPLSPVPGPPTLSQSSSYSTASVKTFASTPTLEEPSDFMMHRGMSFTKLALNGVRISVMEGLHTEIFILPHSAVSAMKARSPGCSANDVITAHVWNVMRREELNTRIIVSASLRPMIQPGIESNTADVGAVITFGNLSIHAVGDFIEDTSECTPTTVRSTVTRFYESQARRDMQWLMKTYPSTDPSFRRWLLGHERITTAGDPFGGSDVFVTNWSRCGFDEIAFGNIEDRPVWVHQQQTMPVPNFATIVHVPIGYAVYCTVEKGRGDILRRGFWARLEYHICD